MDRRSIVWPAAALAALTASAVAADAPPLPDSARRLSGAEIAALYDGKTFDYTSYTFWGIVTGTVTYDLEKGVNHGTYMLGSRSGTFDGTIRVAHDRFCYKAGFAGERCDTVYREADEAFEVKPSGLVETVVEIAQAPK